MQPRLASPLIVMILTMFTQAAIMPASQARPFRIRLSSAPASLDWNIATTGSEEAIIQNIMQGLFALDNSGTPQKVLTKDFSWSADGKTLTLNLKNDILWTDRKNLESRHFLDSFERLLNPSVNSENASLLFDVKGARDYFLGKLKNFNQVGIKAQGKHTLVITLNEPRANFLSILTHPATFPIRKENLHLTLGAYFIKSQSPNQIRLVASKVGASIDEATFEVVPNGAEALQQFKEKKLDYLLQLEDSFLTSPELKGLPEPGLVDPVRVVALLHFNPSRVITNSPEKRRSMMREIPVAKLIENHPKTRAPAKSIIPAGMLGGPSLTELTPFVPAASKEKLPNESVILAYPNDALSKSIAEEIQSYSKNLKMRIEALPKGELSAASKNYDLVLTLFGLDYQDPDQLLSSFLSQGTHDLFSVSSAELLKMIQKARLTKVPQARGIQYAEAADYLENKISIVMPLFYRRRGFLLRENYQFDEKRQGTALLSQIHLKH